MTDVRQLRLVVTASDYDEALRFYRDVLGLREEAAFSGEGGRVTILDAGRATLELADPGHARFVDQVEVGHPAAGHIRVAFEVDDAAATTRELVDAGADLIAEPTRTPWNSLNSRLEAPAGLQLTLFTELSVNRRISILRVTYAPADDRYDSMTYRRSGRSGLRLPVLSLGLWHNFGHNRPWLTQRDICRRAFDLGVTHFDLANNYGPPYGSAEENFGRIMATDLAPYRNELVISTKAGYDMWPGPYGEWGSRKYLTASLDQSLQRMGLDYVDIFYSHRFDPDTPLEETMGALDAAVRAGKALYAGISSYSSEKTREAAAILTRLGTPLLIHQPSYSMINRWLERDNLLDALEEVGAGCIAFSPLAQGMLTDRYVKGVPADSRAAAGSSLAPDMLTESNMAKVHGLTAIAERRGQSLAQLALVWALRDERMTSLVLGASSVTQLEANIAALDNRDLSQDELAEIDQYATEGDINLWSRSTADANLE